MRPRHRHGVGDVSLNINRFAGLPASRRQPEIRSHRLRMTEPARIIDRCLERQRAGRADTGNAHEAPTELVATDNRDDDFVQSQIFLPQRRARSQHAIGEASDQRVACHELADPRLELAAAHPADLEAERLDRVADCVLDVEEPALETCLRGQSRKSRCLPLRRPVRQNTPWLSSVGAWSAHATPFQHRHHGGQPPAAQPSSPHTQSRAQLRGHFPLASSGLKLPLARTKPAHRDIHRQIKRAAAPSDGRHAHRLLRYCANPARQCRLARAEISAETNHGGRRR